MSTTELTASIRRALEEDRVGQDRTTRALLPRGIPARARVSAQATGIVSGLVTAKLIAASQGLRCTFAVHDGDPVRKGTVVLELRGDARSILSVERTLLNYLTHLSGVATATAKAVRAVGRSKKAPKIYATRKTLPGLRDLEKAAVVHGGGYPHRRDLSDALLVKNNHLALVPLSEAVVRTRNRGPVVQIEIRSAREALRAVRAGARSLLIDNASPAQSRSIIRALVRSGLRKGVWIELSGGITPANVRRYARVGADAVSLGALTHSAPALPFHLTIGRA